MKISFARATLAIVLLVNSPGSLMKLSWADSTTNTLKISQPSPGWKPKVTTVSVFKNGLGFFTREGEAQLENGWVHTGELPPAAFGTLAIYASDPDQMVDMIGVGEGEILLLNDLADSKGKLPTDRNEIDSDETKTRASTRLERFIGTSIELTQLHGSTKSKLQGVLKSVTGEYAIFQPSIMHHDGVHALDDNVIAEPHTLQQSTSSVGRQETLAIPLEAIHSVRRLKEPTRIRVVDPSGQGVTKSNLHMAYLRKDILWLPEYTLKIIDDSTAELTLRGTLINEAEDIVDADVNFVVGVPHFVHSDMYAPLAIGHSLRALGNAIPPNSIPAQVMSQVMNRSVLLNNFSNNLITSNGRSSDISAPTATGSDQPNSGTPFDGLLASLPQSESAGSGDYSVYTKRNITVRKGERASVTLMTTKIRYDHRYEWIGSEDVRHLLSLENSTDLPWTTGPCLTLSDGKPLSEDILKYTPPRAKGNLVVTTAINVFKSLKESEIDRKMKHHSPIPGQNFDLVTLRGNIKLVSHEKKPITIRIRKSIPGKPIEISNDGEMNIDSERLRLVDRSGSVEWNLTLDPQTEVILEYVYERYVSSN